MTTGLRWPLSYYGSLHVHEEYRALLIWMCIDIMNRDKATLFVCVCVCVWGGGCGGGVYVCVGVCVKVRAYPPAYMVYSRGGYRGGAMGALAPPFPKVGGSTVCARAASRNYNWTIIIIIL